MQCNTIHTGITYGQTARRDSAAQDDGACDLRTLGSWLLWILTYVLEINYKRRWRAHASITSECRDI